MPRFREASGKPADRSPEEARLLEQAVKDQQFVDDELGHEEDSDFYETIQIGTHQIEIEWDEDKEVFVVKFNGGTKPGEFPVHSEAEVSIGDNAIVARDIVEGLNENQDTLQGLSVDSLERYVIDDYEVYRRYLRRHDQDGILMFSVGWSVSEKEYTIHFMHQDEEGAREADLFDWSILLGTDPRFVKTIFVRAEELAERGKTQVEIQLQIKKEMQAASL